MKRSGSLRSYVITRALLAIPMLLILLTVVFLLMRVAPGDPITAALGGRVSPEELARRRHDAGYDRPLAVQYVEYLKDVATLNLGTTLLDNRPMTQVIAQNGAATLELTFFAMIVAIVVGVTFIGAGGSLKQVVTTQGNDLMHMMQALQKMGTAFLIEAICAIAGFVLTVIAVQGIIVVTGVVVVMVSLAIDILNAWVDPRIRY